MKRKNFIEKVITASAIFALDGCASLINNKMEDTIKHNHASKDTTEFASFGAIHLNITSLQKASYFWTKIAGMKLRSILEGRAEFGTETKTLVIVHETAKTRVKKGYSGLYHFAIHAPNKAEFASMINRLNANKYPYSPVDHTLSKSIYLDDPDGINIEFTLETPERFKRVIRTGGIRMEGTDGVIRSASDRLDLNEVMQELKDTDTKKIIADETYIGHVHLYANDVIKSNAFYKKMGFIEANYMPEYLFADLGAGGAYTHRIVMNSWHGRNKPLAPSESAGMKFYQINFKNQQKLEAAFNSVPDYEKTEDGYWITDPTGNKLLLKQS